MKLDDFIQKFVNILNIGDDESQTKYLFKTLQ